MVELLSLYIGTGLVVSLLFSELFGFAAGGLVVPGYMALNMAQPIPILITLGVAYLAFLIVKVVSSFTIVYGRRRTVLTIVVGYLLGMTARIFIGGQADLHLELVLIGYIIPGLIAIWMDRQGVVETVTTLVTASVIARLVMILVLGGDLSA
jgi:poly-gamma-glutamate biosynthesis protein PgsC/CapC